MSSSAMASPRRGQPSFSSVSECSCTPPGFHDGAGDSVHPQLSRVKLEQHASLSRGCAWHDDACRLFELLVVHD